MGTTALFAELAVGGVLTLTWISLTAVAALGPEKFKDLPPLSAAGTGFLLVVAYALGVVFDRIWDWILDDLGIHQRIREHTFTEKSLSELDRQRRRVFGADAGVAAEFVNYHRSRMRVARASMFNFSLITVSGLSLIALRFQGAFSMEFALTAAFGILISSASMIAYHKLAKVHDRVLFIVGPESQNDRPAVEDGVVKTDSK